MAERYGKDFDWRIDRLAQGGVSPSDAQLSVLMDIRDELKTANQRLERIARVQDVLGIRLTCHETLAIPRILRRISANTAKPKKRKKVTK